MNLTQSTLERNPPRPHETIGCQHLLETLGVGHCGMLRKQLTYRKRGHSVIGSLVKKLPWEKRYVVLAEGSLYNFGDEYAHKPKGCYSLHGYNQVVHAGDIPYSSYPHAFKIIHYTGKPDKVKYFAAMSATELKTWLREIRVQIVIANGPFLKSPSDSSMSHLNMSTLDLDRLKNVADDSVSDAVYNYSDERPRAGSTAGDSDDEDKDDYLEIPPELVEPAEPSISRHSSMRPLPKLPVQHRDTSPPPILANMAINNEFYAEDDPSPPPSSRMNTRDMMPLPSESKTVSHNKTPRARKSPPVPQPDVKPKIRPVPPVPTSPEARAPVPDFGGGRGKKPIGGISVMPGLDARSRPPDHDVRPQAPPKPGRADPTSPNRPTPTPAPKPKMKSQSSEERVSGASTYEDVAQRPQLHVAQTEPRPRFAWKDIYWEGVDNTAISTVLTSINEDGVFLIRSAQEGGGMTLVAYADEKICKYKIKKDEDGQYCIKEGSSFQSVMKLIEFYCSNYLPNKTTPLTEPYTVRTNSTD